MKLSEVEVVNIIKNGKRFLEKNDLTSFFNSINLSDRASVAEFLLSRTTIPILNYMTEIPEYLFRDSTITSIVIPGNIKSIGKGAFFNSSVETVKIENGTKILGLSCFENCQNLTAIDLADTISIIPSNCFKGCINLKKIFLPDGVKNIGSGAFDGCDDVEIVANYRSGEKMKGKKSDLEFLKQHLKFDHNIPNKDDGLDEDNLPFPA